MTITGDPLIELKNVSKVYSTAEIETWAVYQADLAIRKNEFITIMGASGSGKSTLLSVIGLIDLPTSGEFMHEGRDLLELSARERIRFRNRNIGFIFQAFNLIGHLTVYENVELPLLYRGMSYRERNSKVLASLDSVGLSSRLKHYPYQLSGGQQQRVAIARAIVGNPAILLADEPTGNLNSTDGERVMNQLVRLHESGSTICMVTHNEDYADYAQRLVKMEDGKIISQEEIIK